MRRAAPGSRRSAPAPPWALLLIAAAVAADDGEGGAGLLFDGVDDYATVFPGFDVRADWTIEAWVKPWSTSPTETCIFGFQTFSFRNLLTVSGIGGFWSVSYGPDEQTIPSRSWAMRANGMFSANIHQFSLTHQSISGVQSSLKLYLNGTLRADWVVSSASLAALHEPVLPVLLGACHAPGRGVGEAGGIGIFRERFFHGWMDEVRWWDRAMPADQVAATSSWTGPSSKWPQATFANGQGGVAAVAARTQSLLAQYSMDDLSPRLTDGSLYARNGWCGTAGDAADRPQYVASPFSASMDYGPIFKTYRENGRYTLDLLPHVFRVGAPNYNGLLLVRAASGVSLRVPGGSANLSTGALITGLRIDVLTFSALESDSFSVQPCVGLSTKAPVLSSCTAQWVSKVILTVTRSRPPVAGAAYAVRLLREGGFIRLPRLPATTTLEFWVQLVEPLVKGPTILSARERSTGPVPGREILRLQLDPAAGGAVLDACTLGREAPVSLLVPGIATTAPQHLAISFQQNGGSYTITVYQNSRQIASGTVQDLCLSLNSPRLMNPTIGQRYMPDELGAMGTTEPPSQDFQSMYVAELRVWDLARNANDLNATMNQPLFGNETGLVAYARVGRADRDAAATGARRVQLAVAGGGQGDDQRFEVRCMVDAEVCPDFDGGMGFVLPPSPFFSLPSEPVTLMTTGRDDISILLEAYDVDNYLPQVLAPRTVDTLTYEIVGFPDQKCGRIYGQGDALNIRTDPGRIEVVTSNRLPIRFVPFGGATYAEELAMGFVCTAQLRYRAVDSQGLRSPNLATVTVKVLRPGVTLDVVNASAIGAPGAASAGTLISLQFSGDTNRPSVDARGLLDMVNGSWGNTTPSLIWIGNGSFALIMLDANATQQGAVLVPGQTRFLVRQSAGLLVAGDPLSYPSASLSPPLIGDPTQPICSPGNVLDPSSASCHACPAGTFWSPGGADPGTMQIAPPRCLACPPGQFGTKSGALACTACVEGQYMPPGALDRTACLLAPPGTFVATKQASQPQKCMMGAVAEIPGSTICMGCPRNADCASAGQVGSRAVALPGYIRTGTATFQSCRVPKACLGAGVCVEGATDALLGCYACESGYWRGTGSIRDGSDCVKCPTGNQAAVASGFMLAGTVLVVLLLAQLNVTAARQPATLHLFIFKIGIGHMLVMNTFTTLEEWHLELGFGKAASTLRWAIAIVCGWDGMMPVHVFPLECLLGRTHLGLEGRLWLTLWLWVLLPGALTLFCLFLSYLVVCSATCLEAVGCLGDGLQDDEDEMSNEGARVADGLSAVVPVWIDPQHAGAASDPGSSAPNSPQGAGGGNRGWEAFWSEEHARHYYYNPAEGISTWARPPFIPALSPPSTPKAQRGLQYRGKADLVSERLEYRVWGIWRLRRRFRPDWGFLQDSAGIIIACVMLTYPPVIRQLMAFIRCDRLPGSPDPRLLIEPSLTCGEGLQLQLAAVAWVWVFVLGFGVPLTAYGLWYWHRNRLGDFAVSVRIGLLCTEYEHRCGYWETISLLRRFSAVSAACLAPAAPQELRLVLLLAVGHVSIFLQTSTAPFTNQSGMLLDALEDAGLKVFCATAAALLLGLSRVVNRYICAALVLVALLAHVIYMLYSIRLYVRFLQRSIAESVVLDHMKGRDAGLLGRLVFQWEAASRQKQAHIFYKEDVNAIVVSGLPDVKTDKQVQALEQRFVAFGLADCVAHTIKDCRVERLSVHFIEYLARQSFALNSEFLQREAQVERRVPPAPRAVLAPGAGDRWGLAQGALFAQKIFEFGMHSGDFQSALNAACMASARETLEQNFHDFMLLKGGCEKGDYQLTPHERMLKNFEAGKKRMEKLAAQALRAQLGTIRMATPNTGGRPVQKPPAPVVDMVQDMDAEDSGDEFYEEEELDEVVLPATQGASPALPTPSPPPARGAESSASASAPAASPSPPVVVSPQPGVGSPLPGLAPAESPSQGRVSFRDGSRASRIPSEARSSPGGKGAWRNKEPARFHVVPWGVLGKQMSASHQVRQIVPEPDEDTVVVDPAGLSFIKAGPAGAGGAAGAIYLWLGIGSQKAFPIDVQVAIKTDTDAKYHCYADRHVIHVAAPDFRDLAYQAENDAQEALTVAYKNVLTQFAASGRPRLRLLPISGGIFSGEHERELPRMTGEALRQAVQRLKPNARKAVLAASSLEVCVYSEPRYKAYRQAVMEALHYTEEEIGTLDAEMMVTLG